MKACLREAVLRSKQFEVAKKARKVAAMEIMIADFEHHANDLKRLIAEEEQRTGIKDFANFAYSTFAKAARLRRNNLLKSVEDLKVALSTARREHGNAVRELSRLNSESEFASPPGVIVDVSIEAVEA
jgi:flagellar protein FliJ